MSKEKERQELFKSIWSIAEDLRGAVDGWDFKAYVLGMLFYRYISENLTNNINSLEREAGDVDFDYALLSDEDAEEIREEMIETKGFFIRPSELFQNVRKDASKNENLNITIKTVFENIENSAKGTDSEKDFSGLFDDIDVTSNKLGGTVVERKKNLVALLDGIGDMNFGNFQDNSIDAFGDAYEFLMGMYASNAGKSGGEYFTPQEVSELLARLTIVGKDSVNKVYDPACGSGSLLLKYAKILGKDKVRNGFFGQEKKPTTYNLCRINMFLHDIDYDKFDIACGDTLLDPKHWDDEPFEAIVSNPPYSIKWEGDDNPVLINDPRFSPAGVLAPKSKADMAFIMHILSWLAANGTAAIVCFPGIMYRSGAEQRIRKYLVENNFIDAIIQLPDNLFYGTLISTNIMVLKRTRENKNILFMDATKECVKVTNNNKLTADNIKNIINAYTEFTDKDYMCKVVDKNKIAEEDYSLLVSAYVKKEENTENIDINELNEKIKKTVEREKVLKEEIDKILAKIEGNISGKLDELIHELCPNGVEYKKLKDKNLFNFHYGKGKKLPKDVGGIYDVYGANGIVCHINEYNCEDVSIIGHIGAVGIVNRCKGKCFVTYNGTISEVVDKSKVSSQYLYYVLSSLDLPSYKKGSQPFLSISDFENIEVPIPPLSVQEEIVRILDNFTELTDELTAEIKARIQQYEYYRDKLLNFKRLE